MAAGQTRGFVENWLAMQSPPGVCEALNQLLPPNAKKALAKREPSFPGGGGGIRTHGDPRATTVFETAPIVHSGTPPETISSASHYSTPEPKGQEFS
jgi:hypothetical protein